ncbi:alkaline phosphatase [Massilia arenosa]|uniref:Alkaline phosphatase n=1 Tax=Zemynaea arenosa TaxID=2561931 RepID=A0A4Y9SNC3_9BURK|nr:alkaline phosphatase D family protein [Massilia arenosa]TFW26252.1 alkaline phosphatase [Massilia arenosa]
MDAQRRLFLARAGQLAALAAATGCVRSQAEAEPPQDDPFSLGVASGSPLPTAVILWTRILPKPLDASSAPKVAVPVRWEIAEDEGFRTIVNKGTALAAPELAHSVHVDAQGLRPDRWYWYRFMYGGAMSPIGRTRTAPAPDALPASLKLAVASCQHWEFGSYAAHHHIAQASPDLVAFLGDYIYEWGPFALTHPTRPVRENESFTLESYRARYAQYKSDTQLQAAHLVAPWIATWDDHEVANDYAADRDELLSPDFLQRRAAAYQAFYEHMPLRLEVPRNGDFTRTRMYQRYDWGRLARFHVLDDRQYRAYEACPRPGRGGSNSVTRACTQLNDPKRSMLGADQESWLAEGLRTSRAEWNVIAQQTLMARSSQVPVLQLGDGRFWTDGWDGYPAARRKLLESFRTYGVSNPLVLGGDVHGFYATELRADFDRPPSKDNPLLATEFVVTSVTSNSRPQSRTEQFLQMNPHIRFGRSDKRGFTLMELTPQSSRATFLGLDDVQRADSGIAAVGAYVVESGRSGLLKA